MIKKLEKTFSKYSIKDLDSLEFIGLQKKYKLGLYPYDYVGLARHETRPMTQDYINYLFEDISYFYGDRFYGDDPALIGGIAYFKGIPVTFLASNKGKNLEENLKNNFGMISPEGYRKSLRLMKQAEKFSRPIISFIDTPGAYPGIGAEERGQAEAIARNIMEMSTLSVPIITIFTGEGGSGGALALAIANKIIMMEFSIFSILSPEGFATILWKDSSKHKEAAELMKLRARDLLEFKVADRIVKEDIVFSLDMHKNNFKRLENILEEELTKLKKLSPRELVESRCKKFMDLGV